jgi:hypothetical protein
MPRFIRLNNENKVIATRTGKTIVEGEIQSDTGGLGQIMQEDGPFITPTPEVVTPVPTLEDKVNYLYYKSMGVIA